MRNRCLLYLVFALTILLLTGCDGLLDDNGGTGTTGGTGTPANVGELVGQYEMNDGPYAIAIKSSYVYAARGLTIHVVNIANPAAPVKVTELEGAAADSPDFRSLHVDGDRLYAGSTAGKKGFYIFDISNPAAPVRRGAYQPTFSSNIVAAFALFAAGDVAYVASSDGSRGRLVKVDVSNPDDPVSLAQHDLSGSIGSGFGGVWANATHVFADSNLGNLHAFSATDLNQVSVFAKGVDYFPVAGHEAGAYKLVGSGNTLYWCNWGAGLLAMDISDPAAMQLRSRVGHGAGSDSVYSVALDGTMAYVAYGHMTSLFVDIANPDAMSVVANHDINPLLVVDIVLYGNYAILADRGGSLYGNVSGLDLMRIK